MWRTAAVLFLVALAGSRTTAVCDPFPPPPRLDVRVDSVTDLAVGQTLRLRAELSVRSFGHVVRVVPEATWDAKPADVATIAADGTLTALAPGVVEVRVGARVRAASIDGTGPGVESTIEARRFLTIRETLPGGRLPRVRGIDGMTVFDLAPGLDPDRGPDGSLRLRAAWEPGDGTKGATGAGDPRAMTVSIPAFAASSLPCTVASPAAWYGRIEPAEDGPAQAARATVHIASLREGVLSGSVDLVGAADEKVHLDFDARVEGDLRMRSELLRAAVDVKPIAPADGRAGLTARRISPRGPRPSTGLVLVTIRGDAFPWDEERATEWALEGHEVLVVEAPAEAYGDVSGDRTLDEAIQLLENGPDGAVRRVGVLGWGGGADLALRAARRHPELAACVLFCGGRAADLTAPWASKTRVFALFDSAALEPSGAALDAFRARLAASGGRHEVRVESAAEDVVRHDLGFDDGSWNARILKGRARTFVREAMR